MPIGPVEVMVLTFPEASGLPAIAGELEKLVDGGKIGVIEDVVGIHVADSATDAAANEHLDSATEGFTAPVGETH